MSTLRQKLAGEVGTSGWGLLDAHYRRDALFLVDPGLDLLDVAVAVAEDRASEVQVWIDAGRIARPTAEQASAWREQGHTGFRFVIVQPFVLAQPL